MHCSLVPDTVLQERWSDNRPVGKVLTAPGRFVRSVRCPDCYQESTKRLCPECHSDLPSTTGYYKNYIFAVIGAKEAGKSHYLAVLIDQIKKRIGPNQNLLLEWLNEETNKRYKQDFYQPVFESGRIINPTNPARVDAKVQRPLVYALTFLNKNRKGGSPKKRRVVSLVFFDTAGEDLNDEDVMSTVNKYIYRSNGTLLLIDPLQLPQVRDRLGGGTPMPSVNTEAADIITRTTRLVLRGQKLAEKDKILIPLAVAFSKFDAVKPLVDDQFQINASARHDGGFNVLDFQAVNNEMMALLEDWGGKHIVAQVQAHYTRYGFFGLSALGCNPHGTQRIPRVLPRRVEDPFLWLLFENKLIKAMKPGKT